jgi:outer membrane protein OmpA-like peptidoglycan-associated protein
MKARWSIAGLLLLQLLGCAGQPKIEPAPRLLERIVLLPSDTDRPSKVVVQAGDRELLLETPYSSADWRGAALQTSQLDPDAVQHRYSGLLSAHPPRPEPFTMYFELDSDELTAVSKAAFEDARRRIAAWPAAEVVVIGHTDRAGSREYNDRLSRKRARTIANRLVSAGVSTDAIQVAGRGEHEPLIPTPDGATEPRNRRVEIKVR